ncbi:lipase family alpha/beta hydrolase [Streptomyces sp. NPDC058045]|uniref:lipase family alpha/beta hydrolase n=1 Tax=Streptomyces sp. NPDC058045 TaxID=3346311 RepID=UPI0036E6E8BD
MKTARALWSLPFLPLPPLPSLPTLPFLSSLSSLTPLSSLCSFSPLSLLPRLAMPSAEAVKASALEAAILMGHVLLYPSGIRAAAGLLTPAAQTLIEPPETGAGEGAVPLPLPVGVGQPPVLLLHGFVDNRSVFVLLRRALAGRGGRQVESLNHSPFATDIRVAAEELGRRIAEICRSTGHERVDVVGHSLGGLIARYYVQRLGGDERVRTLVTLGTPHTGTRVAPLLDVHPIVRQMRPDSDVVAELRSPAPGCRTRFVAFWSDLDEAMAPLETACVEHPDLLTENVRVTGIGHLALPVHPAVTGRLLTMLGTPPPADTPGQTRPDGGLTVA